MLPDWFKLNCPSCSYRIHPEWVHGHAGTHTHTQACKRYSNTVRLSASTATTILFVKCLEMQLLSPVWTCLRARSGAWKPVCRTYSEVSERRPLKASAAMSEIWFLLRSLGKGEKEGRVHYLGSCYVNVLDLSDKWSWENTSAEVKAGGQEGENKRVRRAESVS